MTLPLSIYLHVPFCERKCPYCAFASVCYQEGDGERYLEALSLELQSLSRSLLVRRVETLYIGGGTPTLFSSPLWKQLITLLEGSFFFLSTAEVTVEANPGSLSLEHLLLWRDWRVTRVSLGVQSLDDAELSVLGRVHTAQQAAEALCACKAAGFSVSADLMFGLPGGTFRNWARTLREISVLAPHHLSVYELSLEEGTPWGENPPAHRSDGYLPYRFAQWYLPQKGYEQYEVASFAQQGHESRHNRSYWADVDYLGIGAAAWGYLDGRRYRNESDPNLYATKLLRGDSPIVFEETLPPVSRYRDAAVLALRTRNGIAWDSFEKKYGESACLEIRERLLPFAPNWVALSDTGAHLTPRGFRVANQIWSELID